MRTVVYLAMKGTTCSSKDIAEDMSIPRDYLIQLAQLPGKHGGYRLAKEPSEISVRQIIMALDEDTKQSTRVKRELRKDGVMMADVKQAYDIVGRSFDEYLDSLTIDLLVQCAENPGKTDAFLADRFRSESERLLAE